MKEYPSIKKDIDLSIHYIVQPKYDGNNIRAEWTPKNSFYKFGSRHQLIGRDSELGKSIPLIEEKYGEILNKAFRDNKYKNVVAFFEYFGNNSFAGRHDSNETQTVQLIDINVQNIGILPVKDFYKQLSSIGELLPEVLYSGFLTQEMVQQVYDSKFPGATFEGVIAKAYNSKKREPYLFKIKTDAWKEKLKILCTKENLDYGELE